MARICSRSWARTYYGAAWEGLGKHVEYFGMVFPSNPKARNFATTFYVWLSEGGKSVPNPIRLIPGGLKKVVKDGFAVLGTGTMDVR